MDRFLKSAWLLLILLLPLLFINMGNYHDWGGDFAQYIHQAQNMLDGTPQNETHVLLDDGLAWVGPKSYPPGLPIVLAPFYAIDGLNFTVLKIPIALFLIGLGIVFYMFTKKRYSNHWLSVTLSLLICYSPAMLEFKGSILSDIPYTFLVMLIIHLSSEIEKAKARNLVLIGSAVGLTFLFRASGSIVIMTFGIFILSQLIKKKVQPISLLWLIIGGAIPAIGFLVFPETLEQADYGAFFNSKVALYNWYKMNESVSEVFLSFAGSRAFMLGALFLVIAYLGAFRKLLVHLEFGAMYFFIHLAVFMLWSFSAQGYRYIIPVMPLFIVFTIDGIQTASIRLRSGKLPNLNYVIPILYLCIVLNLFFPNQKFRSIPDGPATKEAKEAFDIVEQKVPAGELVVFQKPRVLGFYIGRTSFTPIKEDSASSVSQQMERYGCRYILIKEGVSWPGQKSLVKDEKKFQKEWDNGEFALYSVRNRNF